MLIYCVMKLNISKLSLVAVSDKYYQDKNLIAALVYANTLYFDGEKEQLQLFAALRTRVYKECLLSFTYVWAAVCAACKFVTADRIQF